MSRGEEKTDRLTEQVNLFIGASKQSNRIVAGVVAVAAVLQLLITLFHR